MTDPLLDVDGLTAGYGGHTVLAGFSLRLAPGEAVALRGPNGSGKSTLLRCVGGLLAPRAGAVTLAGVPSLDETHVEFRRVVAALLDDAVWYPSLTVGEHVDLIRAVHPAARRDTADLLAALELTGVAGESPVRLSAGQRQRLALAMTFARPSRLLLLDEPERHLDADGRRTVVDLLRAYLVQGGAALVATHDPDITAACRVVDVHPR
jgi:ABC-2 type transport system ATP-binding protein